MKKIENTNKYKIWTKRIAISAMAIMSVLYVYHEIQNHYLYDCGAQYSFINPVFTCSKEHNLDKRAYIELKSTIVDYINKSESEGSVTKVAVFFRDLEAGPTLGINDREDFIPASLLKLPNILALVRYAEEEVEEKVFEQKVTFNRNYIGAVQNFEPENSIKENTPYTIRELIERSLVQSDNSADQLILQHIKYLSTDRDLVADIYKDLGIIDPKDSLSVVSINAKGYASIFRMLYNSSLLDSEHSEMVLEMLGRSSFSSGLRSGVPSNIPISHKFGERSLSSGEKHLHDCGIIYYPDNPYSLCVMTRGDDFEEMGNVIKEISRMFYEEVDSRRIKK